MLCSSLSLALYTQLVFPGTHACHASFLRILSFSFRTPSKISYGILHLSPAPPPFSVCHARSSCEPEACYKPPLALPNYCRHRHMHVSSLTFRQPSHFTFPFWCTFVIDLSYSQLHHPISVRLVSSRPIGNPPLSFNAMKISPALSDFSSHSFSLLSVFDNTHQPTARRRCKTVPPSAKDT